MTEAMYFSKALVTTYQITQRHNPDVHKVKRKVHPRTGHEGPEEE
jgi:hypothetical protein